MKNLFYTIVTALILTLSCQSSIATNVCSYDSTADTIQQPQIDTIVDTIEVDTKFSFENEPAPPPVLVYNYKNGQIVLIRYGLKYNLNGQLIGDGNDDY